MHQWELLVGKSRSSSLPIPLKGNEDEHDDDYYDNNDSNDENEDNEDEN